jgi:transposase
VSVTPSEREFLGEVIRRNGASAHEQRRARILLHADISQNGPRLTDVEIAAAVHVEPRTVARVRSQFGREGFAASLRRRPRQDRRPRKLDGDRETRLIVLACSDPPAGYTRWTIRLLAQRLVDLEIVPSISPETVRTTLKKTGCVPGVPSGGVSRVNRTPTL